MCVWMMKLHKFSQVLEWDIQQMWKVVKVSILYKVIIIIIIAFIDDIESILF